MTIVDEPDRLRHRVVDRLPDPRIVRTACGRVIADIGRTHPRTIGHFQAFPGCNCLTPVRDCCV